MTCSSITALALLTQTPGAPAPFHATPAILKDALFGVNFEWDEVRQKARKDTAPFLRCHAKALRSAALPRTALSSPELKRSVWLKELRLRQDAYQWLRRNLRVEVRAKQGAIHVSLRGCPPAEQARIVNAIVAAYQESVGETQPEHVKRLQREFNRCREMQPRRPDGALVDVALTIRVFECLTRLKALQKGPDLLLLKKARP
jgi:hypothetical protein